jgi:hypothetical protein
MKMVVFDPILPPKTGFPLCRKMLYDLRCHGESVRLVTP